MKPGAYKISEGFISLNEGRDALPLTVTNTGSRAIQIGSHFHFAEANRALAFDREQAIGRRLNIPSGTAVRIEAGEKMSVILVPFGGRQTVRGFNNMSNRCVDERGKQQILTHLKKAGWLSKETR